MCIPGLFPYDTITVYFLKKKRSRRSLPFPDFFKKCPMYFIRTVIDETAMQTSKIKAPR